MIKVTVYKDSNDHYKGFRCIGYAEYAEPGEDIVCSAVSVLVINTINAIDEFTSVPYTVDTDEDSGFIDLCLSEDSNDDIYHDAALLLDTMVMGLQSIEETHSEFIHLEIEEV